MLTVLAYVEMQKTDNVKEALRMKNHVSPELLCGYPLSKFSHVYGVGFTLGVLFKRHIVFYNNCNYAEFLDGMRTCRQFYPQDHGELRELHNICKRYIP